MNFVQHDLCDEIQRLFSQDKNYDRRLAERQLSVMRGQVNHLYSHNFKKETSFYDFFFVDSKFSTSYA